jgi:hypothetical protein
MTNKLVIAGPYALFNSINLRFCLVCCGNVKGSAFSADPLGVSPYPSIMTALSKAFVLKTLKLGTAL